MKTSRLSRRTPLKRKAGIKPVNRTRRERRFRQAFGSPHRVMWLKSMGCDVPGCRGKDVQCAHVKSRAAGGTYRDLVPLCKRHHAAQHTMGIKTFQSLYGLNLPERAAVYHARYEALFPGDVDV